MPRSAWRCASLPEPDVLAAEIVENLAAALEQFRSVDAELAAGAD